MNRFEAGVPNDPLQYRDPSTPEMSSYVDQLNHPNPHLIEKMNHTGWNIIQPEQHARDESIIGEKLVVAIRREPTNRHFDPEGFHIKSLDPQGNIIARKITYDSAVSQNPPPIHTIPGKVEVADRFKAKEIFYQFGGFTQPHIIRPQHTQPFLLLELSSSAPIFYVGETKTLYYQDEKRYSGGGGHTNEFASFVMAGTEAINARLRAKFDPNTFDRIIAEVDPVVLFVASATSILNGSSAFRDERDHLNRLANLRDQYAHFSSSHLALEDILV